MASGDRGRGLRCGTGQSVLSAWKTEIALSLVAKDLLVVGAPVVGTDSLPLYLLAERTVASSHLREEIRRHHVVLRASTSKSFESWLQRQARDVQPPKGQLAFYLVYVLHITIGLLEVICMK